MSRPLVQKKTWRDSLLIYMLLYAVSVLVVAQSSSEIPEGLMNNPIFTAVVSLHVKKKLCVISCAPTRNVQTTVTFTGHSKTACPLYGTLLRFTLLRPGNCRWHQTFCNICGPMVFPLCYAVTHLTFRRLTSTIVDVPHR